ncbi:MAG: hypothetical protein KatS3mg115_0316 [Candidatus Poribacteria bacterium]|nr:MAG: hypothetical protein KatS3mg115_0316 [Candidatus Poribacteria bacterium]
MIENMEQVVVSGVAADKNQAKISILDVPDRPGVAAHIFQSLSEAGIVIDMIIQNVSHDQRADLSFTVPRSDLHKALEITRQVAQELGASGVDHDAEIAKVSIVGIGMKSHSGVAAQMFQALAEAGINIQMISTSEIKISCVIALDEADRAVQVLHDRFGLARAAA